jgi:hypothetical protein
MNSISSNELQEEDMNKSCDNKIKIIIKEL